VGAGLPVINVNNPQREEKLKRSMMSTDAYVDSKIDAANFDHRAQ
jgi:hypothetical protein